MSPAIVSECTDTIGEEVESVKNLVNEFSQFARFPAAQPVPCDLNEVVESALAVFAGRLDGIDLRTDLAAGLPAVNVDQEQFKRVVVNLVDNAAEAMQDSLVKRLLDCHPPRRAPIPSNWWSPTPAAASRPRTRKSCSCRISRPKAAAPVWVWPSSTTFSAEHDAHIRVEDNQPAGARFTVEIPAVVDARRRARTG